MKKIILKIFDKNLECLVNEKGCYICLSLKAMETGYYRVTYLKENWQLHRLVYTFYNGIIEINFIIMHSCDNNLCINIEHLVKGTYFDNIKDRYLKGRSSKGEKHYRSKLTEIEVREIRRSNKRQGELANYYNVP